jgi:hypothetical protein
VVGTGKCMIHSGTMIPLLIIFVVIAIGALIATAMRGKGLEKCPGCRQLISPKVEKCPNCRAVLVPSRITRDGIPSTLLRPRKF